MMPINHVELCIWFVGSHKKRHRGFDALAQLTAEEMSNLGDGSEEHYAESTLGNYHSSH